MYIHPNHAMVLLRKSPPTARLRVAMGRVCFQPYRPRRHWRTRDGRFFLPGEMETGHLVNALRMVLRKKSVRHQMRISAFELLNRFKIGNATAIRICENAYAPECVKIMSSANPLIAEMVRVLDTRASAWRTWL